MATYYIATSGGGGSDSNPGSLGSPWATFTHANATVAAGDTVLVLPGTYSENISLTAVGTAGNPITYQSTVRYGASIVAPSATLAALYFNSANNIFDGFDIQAPNYSVCAFFQNGCDGSILRRNKIHNTARSPFIAGDAVGSPHVVSGTITIDGNLIYDVGYANAGTGQIHGCYLQSALANGSGRVTNNIVFNIPWGFGIHLWGSPTGWDVVNNTVFNCSEAGIVVGSDVSFNMANDRVLNNIIQACKWPVRTVVSGTIGTGVIFENNLDYLCTNEYTAVDAAVTLLNNILNTNPLFVNYQADGSGDYHLQGSSPAIDAGSSIVSVATDYDGNGRPQGASFDIGAYEFGNYTKKFSMFMAHL